MKNASGAVAFMSFASIVALPWWILATGQAGWGELAAFATWAVIGTFAVAVRDGGIDERKTEDFGRRSK